MFPLLISFASLLLASLLVGALFGVWLFLNPAGLDANSYVAVQQQAIRTMNRVMPALGAVTILLTITAAALGRGDNARFGLLAAAVACFISIGLITRFLNQPINAIVMAWGAGSPPADWTGLRDAWWRWHQVRVITGLVALSLLIVAMLRLGWNG